VLRAPTVLLEWEHLGPCSGPDASNWKFFTEAAAHLSFASLASSDTFNSQGEFMQPVSSIEV
jgi:hypothetical protein